MGEQVFDRYAKEIKLFMRGSRDSNLVNQVVVFFQCIWREMVMVEPAYCHQIEVLWHDPFAESHGLVLSAMAPLISKHRGSVELLSTFYLAHSTPPSSSHDTPE